MGVRGSALLISQSDDPNFHPIRSALHHRKVGVYHIDPTLPRATSDVSIAITPVIASASLKDTSGRAITPESIRGVWCRSYSFHKAAAPAIGTTSNFSRTEEIYSLEYFYYLLGEANWVNPVSTPFLTRRGIANRLIQARLATSVGLRVPAQVVSNDTDELVAFFDAHGGRVINKQISQGAVAEVGPRLALTKAIDVGAVERYCRGQGCPVLLQERIPKDHEIRAAVIGDSVYAAAIDTASDGESIVDSREAIGGSMTYYRVDLDPLEKSMLIRLNADLGLCYSSMDLIRQPDGTLVFLEANPSGQWGFLETYTGYPITERIVDELLK